MTDIRLIEPNEAAVLATIDASARAEPWAAVVFDGLLAKPTTSALVAAEAGQPAAYVLVRSSGLEAEILMIATASAARRRGLGRALFEALVAQLKTAGTKELLLEVAADNDAALALYKAQGCVTVGRRTNYYPRGNGAIDALLLRLVLS